MRPGSPLICGPPAPQLQDLDYLSEGLEGRCQSPVALLFDALLRPDTDFGGSVESVLTWRHQKERAIPHLVLGRNPPGGAWHVSGARMGCGDLCQTSLTQVRTLALPTFPYSPPLPTPPSPSPRNQPQQLSPPLLSSPGGAGGQKRTGLCSPSLLVH